MPLPQTQRHQHTNKKTSRNIQWMVVFLSLYSIIYSTSPACAELKYFITSASLRFFRYSDEKAEIVDDYRLLQVFSEHLKATFGNYLRTAPQLNPPSIITSFHNNDQGISCQLETSNRYKNHISLWFIECEKTNESTTSKFHSYGILNSDIYSIFSSELNFMLPHL